VDTSGVWQRTPRREGSRVNLGRVECHLSLLSLPQPLGEEKSIHDMPPFKRRSKLLKSKETRFSNRDTHACFSSPDFRPLAWAALAPILLLTLFTTSPARSGQVKSQERKSPPPARTTETKQCPGGVTLGLTSGSALQGGLLELSISSAQPPSDLKGDWAGKTLPFWTDAQRRNHALLGVDLERPPGKYDLNISGQLAGGDSLTCSATIEVRAGKFAIESLKVAPGFVELSPEDRARADKESERVHEIFARVTAQPQWTGKFGIPLTGNRSGHNFGKRRVLNGKSGSPHTGLDIPAPAGTPIHASQRGRVVLAENLFFSGNTVIVDHGLGVYTFYGHMQSINVAEGEEVNASTILGLVGATGRATGPHLHWSLIVDGARVNPLGIVKLPVQGAR
jgi:murein DD-endopeptidase MepM/ murein hydrolase activator NlpD